MSLPGGVVSGVIAVRTRALVRIGLIYLTATVALEGFWALASPNGFYRDFPVPGLHWVQMIPPYNEHLVTDVGELNLAIGFIMLIAALTLDRLLVGTALVGFLFYSVPHLVYHAGRLGGFSLASGILQTVVLSLDVVVPLLVLAALFWRPKRGPSEPPEPTQPPKPPEQTEPTEPTS